MMINPLKYNPKGDKHNSDYFNEYRIKIYERRISTGLNDLLENMTAIVIQVQTSEAIPYLKELYTITSYRYSASFISSTHKLFCLINHKNSPTMLVIEPLDPNFEDDLTHININYRICRAAP